PERAARSIGEAPGQGENNAPSHEGAKHEDGADCADGVRARAAQGEEIIPKAGRPVAKLVGFTTPPRKRPLGTARGQVKLADDFKAPLAKELRRALGA